MRIALSFGLASPVVLASIVAIVLASLHWKKHRGPSGLVIASVTGFLFYRMVLPSLWTPYENPIAVRRIVTSGFLVLWIMLLCAALGNRRQMFRPAARFRFQVKHFALLVVYTAIVVGFATALIDKHAAMKYVSNLREVPLMLAWGVTAFIVALRYRQHPLTSTLVLCGTLMMIGIAAMDPILSEWQSRSAGSWVASSQRARMFNWLEVVFLSPVATFLVVAAVFTDRSENVVAKKVDSPLKPKVLSTAV